MSFLKTQVSFLSNVASIFTAMRQNSPTFFQRKHFIYLVQKKPINVQIFEIFGCSSQNSSNSSCQFWTDKSVPLQILHHSSYSWHITPLQFLNWYIFNFRQKYAIKTPIWRLSSALVKICRIPYVNLWKYKTVFLPILYQSWVQLTITPLCSFSSNIIYFGQKQPMKV